MSSIFSAHILSDGDTLVPGQYINLQDGVNYGVISKSLQMPEEGRVNLTIDIHAATGREYNERVAAVQMMLALAEKRAADYHATAWVTYILQRGTDAPAYLDIQRGTCKMIEEDYDGTGGRWELKLETLPKFRWPKVELDVTSELTNGAAMLEILNVPGDYDALVRLEIEDTSDDLSGTNAINRIRAARNSSDGALAVNWEPFLNMETTPDTFGGWTWSNVTDATAIDGDYSRMALTTSGGFEGFSIANTKAVTPAGELNQGERDIWMRARATSTAIDLTGSVTATKTEPTITTEATYNTPGIRYLQSQRGGTSSTTASTGTWGTFVSGGNTAVGSTLVTILTGYGGTGGGARAAEPTPGNEFDNVTWELLAQENTPAASTYTTWLYVCQNAAGTINASTGGTGRAWSWTANATSGAFLAGAMWEVTSAAGLDVILDAYDQALAREHTLAGSQSAYDNLRMLGVRVIRPDATHANAVAWFDGMAALGDANGFNSGTGIQAADEAMPLKVRSATEVGPVDLFLLGFRGSAGTPVEVSRVNAGNLTAGSRTFTVYGVDVSGSVGDSIVSSATTLTYDGGKIALSWTAAAADYYIVQWTFGGNTYRVLTNTNSVTITDEADAVFANDMPAITTGQSSGGIVNWMYGAGTDPYPAVSVGVSRMIPKGTAFKWYQLGTANLPPTGAALNGEWPQTTIYLSSSGMGSKNPIIDVDALWLVPHGEPQFIAQYSYSLLPDGWDTETERRWILESTRRGNAMVGWVQNQDEVIRGSVLVTGRMLLAPGDNLISLLCDGRSDSAVIDALTFTAKLTYWPRSHWQNWSTAPDE